MTVCQLFEELVFGFSKLYRYLNTVIVIGKSADPGDMPHVVTSRVCLYCTIHLGVTHKWVK